MNTILQQAIENEIKTFIENEYCYDSVKNNENGVKDYLESLTEKDIENIANKLINNDCLWDFINGEISYTLYHYKDWKKQIG